MASIHAARRSDRAGAPQRLPELPGGGGGACRRMLPPATSAGPGAPPSLSLRHDYTNCDSLPQATITATTQQSRFHTETLESVAQVAACRRC